MFEKKQDQSLDGSGTAIQASGNVIVTINNQGLTAAEVRDIAMDVMRSNLMEFRGVAKQTAIERGEQITEKFLDKLNIEHPAGLQQAQTPDFQDALFTVQKEYAKAGEVELGDLLVDLLVDRTKQENRNLLQLVLNESIHTAPKLTSGQIAVLSVIFFIRYSKNDGFNNIEQMANHFERHIGPVLGQIATNSSAFRHLEFTGCGTVFMGESSLESIWTRHAEGLFKLGFDDARLQQMPLSPLSLEKLIMPCLNDSTKRQVAALNDSVLNEKFIQFNLPEEDRQALRGLFNESTLEPAAIKAKVLAAAPFMENLMDLWPTSSIRSFNLTSVGMAIGHANIKRCTGEFAPLSIWIN